MQRASYGCEVGNHDWTWVEAWEFNPAYYYCVVCGRKELAIEVEPMVLIGYTGVVEGDN